MHIAETGIKATLPFHFTNDDNNEVVKECSTNGTTGALVEA